MCLIYFWRVRVADRISRLSRYPRKRSAPNSRLFAAISLIKLIVSGESLGFIECLFDLRFQNQRKSSRCQHRTKLLLNNPISVATRVPWGRYPQRSAQIASTDTHQQRLSPDQVKCALPHRFASPPHQEIDPNSSFLSDWRSSGVLLLTNEKPLRLRRDYKSSPCAARAWTCSLSGRPLAHQ